MQRTQELFERIEDYLSESLPPEEKEAFEKEMSMHPEFKAEVEKHRELHRILSDKEAIAFRQKLQKVIDEVKNEPEVKKLYPSKFIWKIAASLIILFGLGGFFWKSVVSSSSTSDIYMGFYEAYPVEGNTRGAKENMEWVEAMKLYGGSSFLKASQKLKTLKIPSKQDQIALYLGNSYLKIDNAQAAILQFKTIEDSSRYYEDSVWYQALSYLKLGDVDACIAHLKTLIDYEGIYQDKAQKLFERLQN